MDLVGEGGAGAGTEGNRWCLGKRRTSNIESFVQESKGREEERENG